MNTFDVSCTNQIGFKLIEAFQMLASFLFSSSVWKKNRAIKCNIILLALGGYEITTTEPEHWLEMAKMSQIIQTIRAQSINLRLKNALIHTVQVD